MSPHQSRYAGILNLAVQFGYSQFNFGFIGLATLTPVEQYSAAYAREWFKEYMALANTVGNYSLLLNRQAALVATIELDNKFQPQNSFSCGVSA